MNECSHLLPTSIEKLNLSNDDRVLEILKPRWIGYPIAHQLLGKFEDLLNHPKVARMPNLLLLGRTNSGKTDLVRRFCQKHPSDPNTSGDSIFAPVIYIQAPASPNESELYAAILSALFERIPSSSTSAKRVRVVDVLRKIGLKVMCIDELHNSLAGSSTKQQQFLNALKNLGNELKISFIASGTEDLYRAVSIDGQIQNRFYPIIIPKWELNRDFKQLLRTFESILPLKEASMLYSGALCRKIYAMSEGTIGELSLLLNQAAIYAIRNGYEKIDLEILSECGYIPPSDRGREITKRI